MPQRTALWVSASTLLVADIHLGQAHAARAGGAPIRPVLLERLLAKQLEALTGAIRAARPRRVLMLGDLLHAPIGLTDELLDAVAAWRAGVDAICEVVPGNHDRGLKRAADRWAMRILPDHVREGPFVFTHAPPAEPMDGYVWCGHLHPAVVLARGGDALKIPAFHTGARVGVLPAFTSMAAGAPTRVRPGDRVYAVADGRVIEMTPPFP